MGFDFSKSWLGDIVRNVEGGSTDSPGASSIWEINSVTDWKESLSQPQLPHIAPEAPMFGQEQIEELVDIGQNLYQDVGIGDPAALAQQKTLEDAGQRERDFWAAMNSSNMILPEGIHLDFKSGLEPSTANAIASIPAASSAGVVPFSGSINWSTVSGGFQPLPQTTGQRKKLYQLSQFHGGVNEKSSPRDISDIECQEAVNVTFSRVGRINVLGDLKTKTSSGLTNTALIDAGAHGNPNSGHGWFIFNSAYSLASTPVAGDFIISVSQDGDDVQLQDNGSPSTASLDIANADTHVAPVYYAAGLGLYANDANFVHTTGRQCAISVYRKDYNGTIITSKWVTGPALLTSPTFIASTDGTSDNAAAGKITLEWDDISAGSNVAFSPVDADGEAAVHIGSDADNSGYWDGSYYFFISWLFDGNCETGQTALQTTSRPGGYSFSNERLEFNFSVKNVDSAGVSGANYLGGDARVWGARVYFKKVGESETHQLAEISLQDGVRGSLDSTFVPWDHNSDVYDLETNLLFDAPPELITYGSLNNIADANMVYSVSEPLIGNDTAGPAPHDVRYRAATVGASGVVYIGNISFRGQIRSDLMMVSMPNQPAIFPLGNVFDSPSSDGSPIMVLSSFQNKVLQFKQNSMYVLNVSNPDPNKIMAIASFRSCGVSNPCQVFQAPFGIIFANKHGCFIYDGNQVTSLTGGKFGEDWLGYGTTDIASTINSDAASTPSVGYDPRSRSIIVLKNIGHTPTNTGAWIYNMPTQSWTEAASFILNANGDTQSNFQISPNGYLSMIQYDASDPPEAPFTYDIGDATSDEQTITYWTKDLDFGVPSQTKKLFKVYITYKGKADALTCAYGIDGETDSTELYSFATDSYGGTTDTTPLLDKSSDANLESWHVATLYPDDVTEGKDWKSISLYFSGVVSESFEINDISIMYRLRPIK